MEIREVTETVKVPKGTGVDGFMRTLRRLLELPRLQRIEVDARGEVQVRYFSPDGVPAGEKLGLDFSSLMPISVMRNSEMEEVPEDSHAATAVARLFKCAARDLLTPIAFAGNPKSQFWEWHHESTSLPLAQEGDVYGIPFLKDAAIPPFVIVLFAGFGKGAALIDTVKTYKLAIPQKTGELSPL